MGQDMPGRTAASLHLLASGEMRERIAAFDWPSTPLGTADGWPQNLRAAVEMMLTAHHPMLVLWGPQRIQFYNDAYVPMLGARHPSGLGQAAPACWEEAWPSLAAVADAAMEQGTSTGSEKLEMVMTRNGFAEEVYMNFSCNPIPGEAGAIGGLVCTCTEDTARVLSDRRLTALHALASATAAVQTVEEACVQAAAVLAAIPRDLPFTLLYLLDEDQQTARLVAQTGLQPGTAAAPSTIRPGERQEAWPFADVLATGSMAIVSQLSRRFAGALPSPWPESPETALVLPLARPGRTGLAGFLVAGVSPRLQLNDGYEAFFDLIARQLATAIGNAQACEQERQRAEAQAEIDRGKTAFFSNVGHGFRTPLTLMLGPLEEVLSGRVTAVGGRERLSVAHRNGLRLLHLVNRLLDFSRVEAGKAQPSYEPTDLATYTAALAGSFRSACHLAGLTLVIDCPPLDEPVYVDREMWEKVVLNLVSNAFKYTFEGEICVALRRAAGAALLEVRDMGIGIPAAEFAHIFERFHRIDGARGRTHEGSGIGLALVRELVNLHGGSIEVVSTQGQGSSFTVRLPLGKAHLPPDRIAARRSFAPTVTHADAYVEEALRCLPDAAPSGADEVPIDDMHPSQHISAGGRILVVDDNADMRHHLRQLLSGHYQVDTAPDGEQALLAIDRVRPDLVLADVMMPGLDGFGLLRAVRNQPQTRDLPVILLSAAAGKEAKVEGLDAGADDYLVKPFSARELLARTAANLEMSRVRRQASAAVQQSEVLLESALVAGNMAHWRWDPSTDEVSVSSTIAALLGLCPAEWPDGYHGRDLVHPDDREAHERLALDFGREKQGWETQFRVIRPVDRRIAWMEERASPIVDQMTGKTVLTGLIWDITARKQAEAVIAAQREALEVAFRGGSLESSLGVLVRSAIDQFGMDVRPAFYFANDEGTQLYHVTGMPEGYAAAVDGFDIGPDSVACGLAAWRGQPVFITDVMADPDYEPWWPLSEEYGLRGCWSFPIHSREGPYVGSFALYWSQPREPAQQDIDLAHLFTHCAGIIIARDREASLRRQAEERLRTLMEGIEPLVWRAADGGQWTWSSPQWTAFTGLSAEESAGSGWLQALHPDDGDKAMTAWQDAARLGQLELEARIRNAAGGGYRWFQTRANPVRDAGGAIIEWLGTSTDVHELRALQMRQQVLVAELQHRVRNMLTVVRSVFSRTVETDDRLSNAADHFRGRLDALARTQVIVAHSPDGRADLENLVRDELLGVGVSYDSAVRISGPDVLLPTLAAESMGLAIHELTTNALKYGALKVPGAQLDINWIINIDDRGIPILDFTWRERGVPAVPVRPAREGFGRELIEEALPYRLGAITSLECAGGGVCCRITLPLPGPEEEERP